MIDGSQLDFMFSNLKLVLSYSSTPELQSRRRCNIGTRMQPAFKECELGVVFDLNMYVYVCAWLCSSAFDAALTSSSVAIFFYWQCWTPSHADEWIAAHLT